MDRTTLYRRFFGLLKELGAVEHREDILSGYGVSSTKDLSDKQLTELVQRLESSVSCRKDDIRRLRRQALSILTKIGVCYRDAGESEGMQWVRVNEFLMQPKIAGKLLYNMNMPELRTLIGKLYAMDAKGYDYRKNHTGQLSNAAPSETAAPKIVVVMSQPDVGIVN